MSVDTKKHIFSFVDSLKITKKGPLYNMIKKYVEDNPEDIKDPFADDKPIIRIHKGEQEECQSCSA